MKQEEFREICLEELARMQRLYDDQDICSVESFGTNLLCSYYSQRFSGSGSRECFPFSEERTQLQFGVLPGIEEGFISDLSVYSPYRKRGFAKDMLYAGQEAIKRTGITQVRLRTHVPELSVGFWKHMGFEIDGDKNQEYFWIKRL